MSKPSEQSSFSLASLIGIVWSIHVLIAALLFPRVLLPAEDQIARQNVYKLASLILGTLILFINVLSCIVLFTRHTWIDVAKVFFVLLTWLIVGSIYILFNHLHDIYQLFSLLEDEAIQSRDQSVMLIRAGQAALKAGNARLFSQPDVQFSFNSLLKKVGPLALLLLQKEKNIVHIGLQAGKVLLLGSRLFKNLF